jgi:hypothetical protein
MASTTDKMTAAKQTNYQTVVLAVAHDVNPGSAKAVLLTSHAITKVWNI